MCKREGALACSSLQRLRSPGRARGVRKAASPQVGSVEPEGAPEDFGLELDASCTSSWLSGERIRLQCRRRSFGPGLTSCGHGLSGCGVELGCPTACRIFPDQGLNPGPLYWQAGSQPLDHQGSPSYSFKMFKKYNSCSL